MACVADPLGERLDVGGAVRTADGPQAECVVRQPLEPNVRLEALWGGGNGLGRGQDITHPLTQSGDPCLRTQHSGTIKKAALLKMVGILGVQNAHRRHRDRLWQLGPKRIPIGGGGGIAGPFHMLESRFHLRDVKQNKAG